MGPRGASDASFYFFTMLLLTNLVLIFGALALSSFAVFWARKLKMPHTVLLVAIGVVIGLLSTKSAFSFLSSFHLTPELLFYAFLPALIFESAYNISARKLAENSLIISILSVVSLVVSTVAIGFGLTYSLALVGIDIPLVISLLFGALISATDPVAVLALFKEYGAPRRLSLIFEGESLFNDATAVALFLVLLEVVLEGFHGSATIFEGIGMFVFMIVGGIAFGTLCGLVFAQAVAFTRENEFASISLTIVLAYFTFLVSEILSKNLSIAGHDLHISSIIATTIASLVMGNYGRPKIHVRAEEFVDKLWGQLAFMANSIIFIMVGVLFVDMPLHERDIFIPIILSVVVVAISRALSIYPIVAGFNAFAKTAERIPTAWQHLLSWGSLRGALAVTLVLLIPENLSLPGWVLETTPRDFILALTIGCIFFTIFIKATTIKWFMKILHLDRMTDMEQVEYQEACALTHREVVTRLRIFHERGYITTDAYEKLLSEHEREYQKACSVLQDFSREHATDYTTRVLRIYAIGIEKRHLKDLYLYGEVSEAVYRRIMGKLTIQIEAIERGELEYDITIGRTGLDIFERTALQLKELVAPQTEEERAEELYTYYRAQVIIARKALKELGQIHPTDAESIFTASALTHVIELYTTFRTGSQKKMEEIEARYPEITGKLGEQFAGRGIAKVEERVLDRLYARELITPKLYVTLKDEFHVE